MKMTGHKTEADYKRYAIISEADLEVAAEKHGRLVASVVTATQKAGNS
jgi:hypothetical protein